MTAFNPQNLNHMFFILKDNVVLKEFLKRPNKTALDIGTFYPVVLIELYHDVGFDFFVGLETFALNDNLYKIQQKYSVFRGKKLNTMYDLYRYNLHLDTDTDLLPERNKMLTEKEFDEHFVFYFDNNFDEFIYSNVEQFDAVILSNILHMRRDWAYTIKKAKNWVKSDGLIYIRVNHPDCIENKKNSDQIRFTDEMFLEMTTGFEPIYFNQRFKFKNTTNTISKIFLGKKNN
jgi:SAM-dependent methyltransferase